MSATDPSFPRCSPVRSASSCATGRADDRRARNACSAPRSTRLRPRTSDGCAAQPLCWRERLAAETDPGRPTTCSARAPARALRGPLRSARPRHRPPSPSCARSLRRRRCWHARRRCCARTRRSAVLILSLVRDGTMIAEAAYFDGGPRRRRAGCSSSSEATPVRLEHPLIETELLRRRRATIVLDAHAHPRVDRRLAELMGWRAYAAAPLLIGSNVDRRHPRRPRARRADRRARSRGPVGVRQRARPGLRKRKPAPGAAARARADAPVPRVGRRPLRPPHRAHDQPGDRCARTAAATGPFDADSPAEGRDDRAVFAGPAHPA